MRTIFNTDLEPMPLHNNGKWIWNGYEITDIDTDKNGEQFQRKGMWMWVANDTKRAWMADASIKEINDFYKPQPNERIGDVLNKLILGLAVTAGVAMAALLIL